MTLREVKTDFMPNMNADNLEKYSNYRTQMSRLKKAMSCEFYLEAIFIEYAIIEDRAEAVLRYEDNSIRCKEGQFISLDRKLNKILDLAREKKSLPNKYFDSSLIEEIRAWKEDRNGMIHALMKKNLTKEYILSIADRGMILTRCFTDCATKYRRAVERRNQRMYINEVDGR